MERLIKLLCCCVLCFFAYSCSVVKEIPVQTIEKIEYRDSLVFIKDTVEVQIEKQVVKEILPQLDTSLLQTDLAESIAYLDTTKRQIYHTLEQRGKVKYIIDTIYKVEYIDRIIEKEIPIKVEIVKYKRDNIFWISIILNILVIAFFAFKIYLKLK